jgi:peptide/nickel transport system ATP-binding protein
MDTQAETDNKAQSVGKSAEQPTLLSVQNLRTEFELRRWVFGRAGFVRAVDGVSFELKRGEAIAVVGESGCGKSSLAKTILGLYRPARGEVIFEGKNLAGLNGRDLRWYRSQVGYVQQDPYGALPPFMSVRRILEEPLIINTTGSKTERERRVREVLEEVRLTPVEDFLPKFPHMLSGGQQQRVVIARAMILRPKLLVADEPVSMLDASVRVEILELLHGLQRAHDLGVIYITHDLSSVRHFSDRIFVMYAAKIIGKLRFGNSYTTLSILTHGRYSRRFRIPTPKTLPFSNRSHQASRQVWFSRLQAVGFTRAVPTL